MTDELSPEMVAKILEAMQQPPVASFTNPEEANAWLDTLIQPKKESV